MFTAQFPWGPNRDDNLVLAEVRSLIKVLNAAIYFPDYLNVGLRKFVVRYFDIKADKIDLYFRKY